MTANGELQKQIVNYAKTRAVYVEYRKAGYSKKFRAEHEADILLHQAAKKYFDSIGITKLPSVKSLREEYAGLLEQKRKAYAAYKQARSDMKELHNIKANVDYLLDIPASQEQQKDKQNPDNSFMLLPVSAFRRNAQPSPQVTISGVWGYVTNKHFRGFHGNGKSSKIRNLTEDCIACR